MIELTGRIVGSEGVQQKLLGITPQARTRVRDEVKRQGLEVLRLAKAKVSDDLLHVRTGRLRRFPVGGGTRAAREASQALGLSAVPLVAAARPPPHLL